MDDSIPIIPSSFISVAELESRLKSRHESGEKEGSFFWSYRCNGFLFDNVDVDGHSGYDFLLASSRRPSSSSASVKVDTKKVVPWPEDVRDGDLVQVVGDIQRSKLGEMVFSAISVVRITDFETDHDLNVLQASHAQIIAFMQQPRPNLPSFSDLFSMSMSADHRQCNVPLPPPSGDATGGQPSSLDPSVRRQFPLSTIDTNSLFDEYDDDQFELVSRLDKLSSTSVSPTVDIVQNVPSTPQNIPSITNSHSISFHRASALASKNAGKFSSRMSSVNLASSRNSDMLVAPFRMPAQASSTKSDIFLSPNPPMYVLASALPLASKNTGKFSGGAFSRTKGLSSDSK